MLDRFTGSEASRATPGDPGSRLERMMPVLDWRDQEATNETIFREMNEWTDEEIDGRIGLDPCPRPVPL